MSINTPFTKEDYEVLAQAAREWPIGSREWATPEGIKCPGFVLCIHREKTDDLGLGLLIDTLDAIEAAYHDRWKRDYLTDLKQSPSNVARRFAMMAEEAR